MARQSSEFVKAFGTMFEIVKALVNAVFALGGTDEHMRQLLKDDKLVKELAVLIMAAGQQAAKKVTVFLTFVNNPLGLSRLIQEAVGPNNIQNINNDITPERFKLGQGVREVHLEVMRFKDGEMAEECAKRLVAEGFTLENMGELAAFMAQHPQEVEKYSWVLALGEDSRWSRPGGRIYVPYASVYGAHRSFGLDWFSRQFNSSYGVLVSRKQP